jgi:hypothetical protein
MRNAPAPGSAGAAGNSQRLDPWTTRWRTAPTVAGGLPTGPRSGDGRTRPGAIHRPVPPSRLDGAFVRRGGEVVCESLQEDFLKLRRSDGTRSLRNLRRQSQRAMGRNRRFRRGRRAACPETQRFKSHSGCHGGCMSLQQRPFPGVVSICGILAIVRSGYLAHALVISWPLGKQK